MKFRTDFVTNSSSSSFIFQKMPSDMDMDRVHRRLQEKLENTWSREETDRVFETMLGKIKPIWTYEGEAVREVFEWYRDDVIFRALDRVLDLLQGEGIELPDETLRVLAGVWYMDRLERYVSLSRTQIEEELLEYLENGYEDIPLYECVLSNQQKFTEAAFGFADMELKNILPMVLGAEFMFYDTLETPWFIAEIFRAEEACLFGCNHMG